MCASNGPRPGVHRCEGNDDATPVKHELLQLFVLVLGRIFHIERLRAEREQRRAAAFAQFVHLLIETLHADAAQTLQAIKECLRAERIGAERRVGWINVAGLKAQLKQSPHAQAEPHQQHKQQHEDYPVFIHRLRTL